MSLTPQTLRCYPKAEIRQGADRVSAPTRLCMRRAGACHQHWLPAGADDQLANAAACRCSVSPMSHHKRRIALLVIAMAPPQTATRQHHPNSIQAWQPQRSVAMCQSRPNAPQQTTFYSITSSARPMSGSGQCSSRWEQRDNSESDTWQAARFRRMFRRSPLRVGRRRGQRQYGLANLQALRPYHV